MKRLFIASLLVMAGCSTIQDMYTDVPKGVAVAQQSLATAEHAALAYTSLPVCGKTTAILCKTPVVETQIGAADQKAFALVEAAYQAKTQDTLSAAQTALNTLLALTNSPIVQQAISAAN